MGNAAAKTLHELGYRNLTNLEGGAMAWKNARVSALMIRLVHTACLLIYCDRTFGMV